MIIALPLIGPLFLLTVYATLYWVFRNNNPNGDD